MKTYLKHLLLVVLCICNLHALMAQMNDGAQFGLVAGINGSSLYDDARAEDKKSRLGYTVGAFGQIPLIKGRFSIRPELLFSAKGATFDFQGGTRPEVKLSYVELPVSLQWHLIGFLNIHAGVYASLLANADGKLTDANGNPVNLDFEKKDYSNIDYGWHVGGGLDLGNLGIHLRVTRGLKGVAANDNIKDYLGDLKNSTWALTLGWAF